MKTAEEVADETVRVLYGKLDTATVASMLEVGRAEASEATEVKHLNAALERELSRRYAQRKEHMQWAKRRALEELDRGSVENAIASMLSDMGKHRDLAMASLIGAALAMSIKTPDQARRWIEGFA